METYVALDMNEEKEMKDAPIPHRKIEQLKKVMKSHRAAIVLLPKMGSISRMTWTRSLQLLRRKKRRRLC